MRSFLLNELMRKSEPESQAHSRIKLTFDDSRDHHVMMGAEGSRILINSPCESDNVFTKIGKCNNLIDESPVGAINRP